MCHLIRHRAGEKVRSHSDPSASLSPDQQSPGREVAIWRSERSHGVVRVHSETEQVRSNSGQKGNCSQGRGKCFVICTLITKWTTMDFFNIHRVKTTGFLLSTTSSSAPSSVWCLKNFLLLLTALILPALGQNGGEFAHL